MTDATDSMVEYDSDNPRYPNIEVQLVGLNGNAMVLIGAVRRALRSAGVSNNEINEFSNEAMSGDYDHVIQTCMSWVSVS